LSQGRPQGRHRLPKPPRTRKRVAVVAAPLATAAVVGAGIGTSDLAAEAGSRTPTADTGSTAATPAAQGAAAKDRADLLAAAAHSVSTGARQLTVSRDLDRLAPAVTARKWTTTAVNLYAAPRDDAHVTGEVQAGKKVAVTGRSRDGFAQVVVDATTLWVHQDYLADKKPAPPSARTTAAGGGAAAPGLEFKPCAASASVEHGLVPDAVRAWEAVCNAFPEVSEYGGVAARPEHDTGHAVDAMVYGNSALGYRIAEFLRAHASELNLYDIIYRQHIWTPVRASEGWRLMPDRGSATANHMDHVHFAVN
jgi:hypothetical protein